MKLSVSEMKSYVDTIGLRPGDRLDVNHLACPDGTDTKKRLNIRRTDNGSTYLFRCNHCGRGGGYHLSAKQGKRSTRTHTNSTRGNGSAANLPSDTSHNYQEFPASARLWLSQGGITPKDVSERGIGYSPSFNRLLLPAWREGKLKCFQARRLADDNSPKYLSYGSPGDKYLHLYTVIGNSKHLTIVEDYLSCIRVSKHTDALAIFTTSLPTKALEGLLRAGYIKANVFLDNDNVSVRRKERQLVAKLSLFMDVTYIQETDPKNMSEEVLRDLLSDASTLTLSASSE